MSDEQTITLTLSRFEAGALSVFLRAYIPATPQHLRGPLLDVSARLDDAIVADAGQLPLAVVPMCSCQYVNLSQEPGSGTTGCHSHVVDCAFCQSICTCNGTCSCETIFVSKVDP